MSLIGPSRVGIERSTMKRSPCFRCLQTVSHETLALRVQRTNIWGMNGFYTKNRNSGFGNILCIWVLGPLG